MSSFACHAHSIHKQLTTVHCHLSTQAGLGWLQNRLVNMETSSNSTAIMSVSVEIPRGCRVIVSNQESEKVGALVTLSCNECGDPATACEVARSHSPSKCCILRCGNSKNFAKCSNWFACCNCTKGLDKRMVGTHLAGAVAQSQMGKGNH